MKNIAILGSTGSIGTSTLDVVRANPEKFKIIALSCGSNVELLARQIMEFKPALVSVNNEADLVKLKSLLSGDHKIEISLGAEGNVAVACHPDVHFVVSAIVGAAGLVPTYAAIQSGKNIGLANKETLVIAGTLMTSAAKTCGVELLPIDSEHSAIFQCLNGEHKKSLRKIIVTASGGPFLHKSSQELNEVSVEAALKHPNWSMGNKITIDSATLMNKGLEVIEAKWLFDVAPAQIEVVVHPQSIVHSMVEFCDGSVIAQLGIPDMRIPIAYAMAYPDRLANQLPSVDLVKIGTLTFLPPDMDKFKCLKLARQSLADGGTYTAVLNAANEIAVAAFLKKKISFVAIADVVQSALEAHQSYQPKNIDEVIAVDTWARAKANQHILQYGS